MASVHGEVGTETSHSSVKILDGRAQLVRRYDANSGALKVARRIVINSRNRDTSIYPSANSFTIGFAETLKGTCYLELVRVNLPSASGGDPQDRVVIVANGTLKNGKLEGCDSPKLSTYETAMPRVGEIVADDHTYADNYAMARINYDPADSSIFWESPRNHPLSRFAQPTDVDALSLCLVDNSGAPYNLPGDGLSGSGEWTAELIAYTVA